MSNEQKIILYSFRGVLGLRVTVRVPPRTTSKVSNKLKVDRFSFAIGSRYCTREQTDMLKSTVLCGVSKASSRSAQTFWQNVYIRSSCFGDGYKEKEMKNLRMVLRNVWNKLSVSYYDTLQSSDKLNMPRMVGKNTAQKLSITDKRNVFSICI